MDETLLHARMKSFVCELLTEHSVMYSFEPFSSRINPHPARLPPPSLPLSLVFPLLSPSLPPSSRGLLRSGVGVETVNCEFASKDEIASVINRCCGFVLGSPTLAGHMPTPVQVRRG